MNVKGEIKLASSRYDELVSVSKWYEQMPNFTIGTSKFYAGDHFHERMFEFRTDCFDDGILNENQYLSHFELVGDNLFAVVGTDGSTEEEHYQFVKV